MVKNIANKTTFYCLNHDEPVELIMRERTDGNHDNFYACPKFMRKDENHPDGYDADIENGCANRLSLSDAGDILAAFNKIVEEDLMNGVMADYTNYTFTFRKYILVKVLEYKKDVIRIGVLNKKAVS